MTLLLNAATLFLVGWESEALAMVSAYLRSSGKSISSLDVEC